MDFTPEPASYSKEDFNPVLYYNWNISYKFVRHKACVIVLGGHGQSRGVSKSAV
jgi:hypothetical protein